MQLGDRVLPGSGTEQSSVPDPGADGSDPGLIEGTISTFGSRD